MSRSARRWKRLLRQAGERASYLLVTALLLGSLAATFVAVSHRAAKHAVAEAERLPQAVALGIADRMTRALQSVDFLLLEAAARSRSGSGMPLTPEMAALAADMPRLRALLLADADGRTLAAGVPDLVGARLDGPVDFPALRRASNRLWVGRPEPGRWLDGKGAGFAEAGIWSIPLARAVRGDDGGFLGAAVALLNPDYLASIAQRPADAFGALVRIHAFDGTLVARSDGTSAGIFRVRISVGLLPDAARADAPALAGRRILVVSRPGPARDSLGRDLARFGIVHAEAEDRLAAARFDAVIVDERLEGGETGIEAAEALRAAGIEPAPRFILATGGTQRLQARRGLFDAVLLKPALPSRQAEALAHALSFKPRPAEPAPRPPRRCGSSWSRTTR